MLLTQSKELPKYNHLYKRWWLLPVMVMIICNEDNYDDEDSNNDDCLYDSVLLALIQAYRVSRKTLTTFVFF